MRRNLFTTLIFNPLYRSVTGKSPLSCLHCVMHITPEEMLVRKVRRDEATADGKIAMAEYLAEPEQRAANTAKQREARLGREASDAKAAAATMLLPPVKKTRKKKAGAV